MLYGTSYYPLHYQKSDYHQDFKKMKQLGFNCIRTAELICSWDWLEKEEGCIDFTAIDIVFELAEKYQMQVILGTGSSSPPAWLLKKYADIRIKDRQLLEYPLNGMWSGASIFHPEYLKAHQQYLNKLIERYQNHDQLFGWQIHNEAGYPFVDKIDQARSFFDYSRYAVLNFQIWLEEKYKSVDALFEAWRWTPSNQAYASFNDVEAPTLIAAEWGSAMAWQDWILFHKVSWTHFIEKQHNFIKEKTNNQPTIINFYGRGIDWDASGCIDPFSISEHVDIIGYDIYPWLIFDQIKDQPNSINTGFLMDFYRSISIYLNKPLFLPEVESGPIGGFFQGPNGYTTKSDILKYFALAVARNCQSFIFQAYREWEALPLHWGAIVDFKGTDTERTKAAKTIGDTLQLHGNICNAEATQAQIELVYDYNNIIAFSNTKEDEVYKQALLDLYQTLIFAGYQVGFINIDYLTQSKAQCVIFPRYLLSDDIIVDKLNHLNKRKISVICFAKTAYVNQHFKRYRTQPGAGFDQFFSIDQINIKNKEEGTILLDNQRGVHLKKHLKQALKITDSNATIASFFADQTAAAILTQHEQINHLYFSFDLDNALDSKNQPLREYFVEQIKTHLKITPRFAASETIEMRLLEDEKQLYLIVTNRILGEYTIKNEQLLLPLALQNKKQLDPILFDENMTIEIKNHHLIIDNLQSAVILIFSKENA